MLYLRAHYRSPIEYSDEVLEEASEALDRLDRFRARSHSGDPDETALDRFRVAMDDDFATPEALSVLFDLVRDGNRLLDEGEGATGIAGAVESIVEVLGLDDASEPSESEVDLTEIAFEFGVSSEAGSIIEQLIEMRKVAREEGRYSDADAIRDRLDSVGVALEDGPDGTRWLRK